MLMMLAALIAAGADNSLVYSGKYEIRKCNAGQANSMASKLQKVLPMVWSNLQTTIADSKKGIASAHGYSAFFKQNENIPAVQKIYTNIASGNPVDRTNAALRSPGRHINPLNLASPGFICIQNGDPGSLQAYLACTGALGPGGVSSMIAAVGAQYVFQTPTSYL